MEQLTGYPSIDKPWMKYYSEEEREYSIPKIKIVDYMYQCTQNYENEIALEFMKRKITYKTMREKIENTACSLKEIGVKEGDVISVCLPNMPEVVYLFYAINKVGAVANMLDPRNSEWEFLRLLKEVNTTWLFGMDTALEKFSTVLNQAELEGIVAISVLESLPLVVKKIALHKDASLKANLKSLNDLRLLTWKEFEKLGKGKINLKTASYKGNAPAVICYTGGSTGIPKGAIMSDYNFNAYIVGVHRTHYSANIGAFL